MGVTTMYVCRAVPLLHKIVVAAVRFFRLFPARRVAKSKLHIPGSTAKERRDDTE